MLDVVKNKRHENVLHSDVKGMPGSHCTDFNFHLHHESMQTYFGQDVTTSVERMSQVHEPHDCNTTCYPCMYPTSPSKIETDPHTISQATFITIKPSKIRSPLEMFLLGRNTKKYNLFKAWCFSVVSDFSSHFRF